MQTDADEKFYSACEHIKNAIRDLSAIIVDDVHGYEDYKDARFSEVLQDLISVKKKLRQ